MATLLRFVHVFGSGSDRSVIACEAHRALAREAAQKSIVLLRNEGEMLPLDPSSFGRLALIGELAVKPNIGDGGSSDVHPPHVVTPMDGLRAALPGVEIIYVDGTDLAEATAAAKESDVAIVIAGYTRRDEGEYIEAAAVAHLFDSFPPMTDPAVGERMQKALQRARENLGEGFSPGGDRVRISLRESEESLIEAVAATNPRTVVAVMGGSAVVMERWRQRVPAIVLLWYPGMEGGHALADIILGKVNPGGRLPFAIPTNADHLAHFDRDADKETYDLWHGQWKLDRDGHSAAYPFGFGLSYTSFSLRNASIQVKPSGPQASTPDPPQRDSQSVVRVTVTNTGTRAGAEVVQVYGGMPASRYERPRRRLLGFARVELEPGEARTIEVNVPLAPMAVRQSGKWLQEEGRYEFTVARNAGDPEAHTLSVSLG